MFLLRMSKGLYLTLILVSTLALMGCPSDDVVVIDDQPEISLDDISGDQLDFNYSGDPSQPLEVGDIVAGSEGGGYLRRLMALDQDGNVVTASTEQVSLAEAVEVGVLDAQVEFTSKDFAKAGYPLVKDGETKIDLSGTVLYNQDGLSVTITHGTIDFAPTIDLDASWTDHKLTYLRAVTEGTLDLDFDVEFAASKALSFAYEVDVFPPVTKPFVFSIGPIPVVGTAYLSFPFGVVGTCNGSAAIEAGFDWTAFITLGGEWSGGAWQDLSNFNSLDPNLHPPILTLASGAGVDVFVKPKAGLELYGCSDLSGSIIPYLSADAWFIPPPVTFVVGAGIDGVITYELGIFDWNLVDESWYFPGPYWELYRWQSGE